MEAEIRKINMGVNMTIKYNKEIVDEERSYIYKTKSGIWNRIREVRQEANQYIKDNSYGPIWTCSVNGKFSANKTWNAIRDNQPKITSFLYIWHKGIPSKISVFMWKMIHGKLPLDENLKKLGINIVSKCLCCEKGENESIPHLFFKSGKATTVWNFFICLVGYRVERAHFNSFLKSWWFRVKNKRNSTILCICLPAIICWEIWKERNRAFFEDASMYSSLIINNVKSKILEVSMALKLPSIPEDVGAFLSEIVVNYGR